MFPINSNQRTTPFLASHFPNLLNTPARTDSTYTVYETAESVMQINYGLINIPVYGWHNTVTVNYHSTPEDAKVLAETLRPLQSMALQPNTAPLASLGIQQLQKRYLEGQKKDNEIKDALAMYVAPECTLIMNPKERFSLEEKVRAFLTSEEKKVLLLLGEAGSGKSTFNRYLARSLWRAYDNKADKSGQTPIPLFISLSSLKEPNANLIYEYLKKENFSDIQIADLKENYRFIFILDGYDEIKDRSRLFYVENELDQWQAKVIITSRPEYLGDRYERQFHSKGEAHLLQGYRLAPFSNLTIEEYVAKYKNVYPEFAKSVTEYGEILEQPEVKELVRNPFLLKLALSELPALGQKYKESSQRITRLVLYGQFVESWFERSQDRLSGIGLTDAEQKAFHFLNKAFTKHGTKFSKDFAIAMYQAGLVRVTYSEQLSYDQSDAARQDWRDKFLSDGNEQIKLLRFNAPLICRDDQYQFIHKSIQDYFVARALWEELDVHEKFESSSWFNTLNIVNDPAVLQFLAERVRQNPELKTQLLSVVEQSKGEEGAQFERGAANAMTILVRAGVPFNGADLKGIQISGADLSFGIFDSAQLQGADLSNVNLRNSWLRGANLSGAQMAGVQFGEWPFLQVESHVLSCAYSPDGKTCAIGLRNGNISVYDTLNWEKIHTLEGHTGEVRSVVYSPSGKQIASGSGDTTVRLWDAQTGAPGHTLRGHTYTVYSVMYSPTSPQIASGSGDKTVRLWDAHSGALGHTLEGHTSYVNSVVYSPSGSQIASGSQDNTVRLWDAQTGEPGHTLQGHTDAVLSVGYSPTSSQIASGSDDDTVRLWDAQTGALRHTLQGHTESVFSVVYSPSGEQIASGSIDKTVRLWGAQIGATGHTLPGHTNRVRSVVYSPSGEQIASGSEDKTLRLWDAQTGELGLTLRGHTNAVLSVGYSPTSPQIASGSFDKTVRLWDAQTGAPGHTLQGHTRSVLSVVYSPSGQQIASGSWDQTVRLWDAQTGEPGLTLQGHTNAVFSVVYSPSGQQIASGSIDNTVRLWDAQTGEPGHTLQGHTNAVFSVVYSPSGEQIASGSHDQTVRLWDAHSGALGHTLEGHTDAVFSVVYSPSGTQIASGGQDKAVRLWETQTGQCQMMIQDCGIVTSLAWKETSDGHHYLVIGSMDNSVRQWEVKKEGEEYKAVFCWSSTHSFMTVRGTSIEGVRGLGEINQKLLKQRGAVGEPSSRSREASQEIITDARFRQVSNPGSLDSLAAVELNSPAGQSTQPVPSKNDRIRVSDLA